MIGIIYGAKNLLTGRIMKVGSTTQPLAVRASQYRQDYSWFRAEPYELVTIQTVEHSDSVFFMRVLRRAENCEIARQHTWVSEGGYNIKGSIKVPRVGLARPDGRAVTSPVNGRLARFGGRPRVQIDWPKGDQLRLNGASDRDIASALGISRRTLKRRIADRREQDDLM